MGQRGREGRPHGRGPGPSASAARDRQAIPTSFPAPDTEPHVSRSVTIILRPSAAVSEILEAHEVPMPVLAVASAPLGPRAFRAACHRRIASRRIMATLAIRFFFPFFPASRR